MSAKGILGRKLGMTQIWDDDNRVVPVTVIEAGPCRVVQLKTPERDGYSAVQLSFGDTKPQRLSKPELGHLKKADAPAHRHLAELRVDDLAGFEVGQVIGADVFGAGERVDVTGISKGKGFSGAMQRHNFKGQGASHGNHKKHRSPGSVGACATPARVFKGMKMAGQYGNVRITTQNLEVVEGDAERGILLIKGAVPGPNGSLVFVRNAAKARSPGRAGRCGMKLDVEVADRHRCGHRRTLPDELFGIEPNVAVMHQVVTAQLAAARAGTHSTKTRAEVAGGGAKPWRQKGTGRARQGSIRAPHWRGGGVAHGPKPRDYRQRTPKKMIRLAPALAHSRTGRRRARSSWSTGWGIDEPRTKDAIERARRARPAHRPASATSGCSSCCDRTTRLRRGSRSATSVSGCSIILPEELNTYDVLVNDWLVFTTATLEAAVARLGDKERDQQAEQPSDPEGATPVPPTASERDQQQAGDDQ